MASRRNAPKFGPKGTKYGTKAEYSKRNNHLNRRHRTYEKAEGCYLTFTEQVPVISNIQRIAERLLAQ